MASPGYRRCPEATAYPQDTDSVLRIPRYPQDTAGVLRYKWPHGRGRRGILRIPCPQDAPRVPGSTPTLAFSDVRRGSLYHSLSLSLASAHTRPLGLSAPPSLALQRNESPLPLSPPWSSHLCTESGTAATASPPPYRWARQTALLLGARAQGATVHGEQLRLQVDRAPAGHRAVVHSYPRDIGAGAARVQRRRGGVHRYQRRAVECGR